MANPVTDSNGIQIKKHDKELQNVRLQINRLINITNVLTKENSRLKHKVVQLTHDIASLQRKV